MIKPEVSHGGAHVLPPPENPTASVAPADGAGTTRVSGTEFGTPPAPATPPADRYVLHTPPIARGGMGEVFEALDQILRREIAIKVLRSEFVGRPTVAARFIDEARITGGLQHPGIPPVHDLGTLPDGRQFLAMKLIRGHTLSDVVTEHTFDQSRLLAIFEQIVQTVAYAHSKMVIHRDLKPGNVMVGKYGEVQVMDWGLAKVLGEPTAPAEPGADTDTQATGPLFEISPVRELSGVTRAGSVLGTPAYMPPEQAIGAVDQIDARSDVFGLGGILCVILTGKPPYIGGDAESTRQLAARGKLDDALVRLARCGADPELVALCKRCLAAEKADRPADGEEVAKAVAGIRAAAEERVRKAELDRVRVEGELRAAQVQATEARKRRRVQLALVAAGVLLLLGGGAGAWWQDRQAAERRRLEQAQRAEVARIQAQQERTEAEQKAELARIEAEHEAEATRIEILRKAERDRVEAVRQVEAQRQAQTQRDRLARNAQAIEALLVLCEESLRADDPDRVAVPLGQIDKRLDDGGVDHLKGRIDQCRADLTMLHDLNRADDVLWSAEEYRLKSRRSSAAFAEAFGRYGIVLDTTPTAEAARRVTGSQIRERLLQALDLWYLHHTIGRRPPALRKLLEAADPDPFRNEVRNAILRSEAGWNKALVEDEQAFQQPPRFAVVFGQAPHFPAAAREQILRRTVDRSPGNFYILLTLSQVYESEKEFRAETASQQLRWAQAAVSVRPQSKLGWRSLGRAHWDRGRLSEALACYRRAARLDPTDYNSLTQLSAVLIRIHDPEAAIEAANAALALNPDYSIAHLNRGAALDRMGRYEEALREYELAVDIDTRNGVETAQAYNSRGYGRLRKGDYDGAIADFRESLRISPDSRQTEANLASARQLKRGDTNPETAPPPREAKR